MKEQKQHGTIGVTTENIFPIIKKFLYSDHEIFLRELISNAVDATQKLKTLASMGEFKEELGDLTIRVAVDAKAKTLTISDAGIGMTAEEVDQYINQIAFSSAGEFMKKYQNQAIIGHFGLGFYSAFMVSDRVEIVTRSWQADAKTVRWSCAGTPEYTLEEEADRHTHGTDIILHLSEENGEFAQEERIRGLLRKYCRFLPVPIACGKVKEWKEGKYVDTGRDEIVNNTDPLWIRKPADLKADDYLEFYRELYPMADDPLFHIHLNIDYPFNLTGILYFPKIRNQVEIRKDKIQLYCNQVYVTDSVEGIVPEFLTLLHGVIDSPDIPLNVSRSYLQNDSNVKKISTYITRKVADRLQEIFTEQRAEFEQKWDDLKIFIQYGMVTEEKFAEKAKDFVLLKNSDAKYFTLAEYGDLVKSEQTDREGNMIWLYTNDAAEKHSFVEGARAKGYDVLVMDGQLDSHFISWFEHKNEKTRFVRVDSDVIDKLIRKEKELSMSLSSAQQELLRPVFEAQLPLEEKVNYAVSFEPMEASADPVVITQNEYMRRMKEISRMGGDSMGSFYGQMPDSFTIAVNGNHPLVIDILSETEKSYGEKLRTIDKKIDAATAEQRTLGEQSGNKKESEMTDDEKKSLEEVNAKVDALRGERNARLREIGSENPLVKQLIDLALLSNGMLKGEKLTNFIRRSVELIGK